jgi:hypothetical protein
MSAMRVMPMAPTRKDSTMQVLTATARTQGRRHSDFTWCAEGEVVIPPQPCDRDRDGDPDEGCGCGRAFVGLYSRKGTTTAMIRERDGFDLPDLVEALRSSRQRADFAEGQGEAEITSAAIEEAITIVEIVAIYDTGTVLECRNGEISERS